MTVVTQPAFITEFGDLLGEVLSAEQLPDLLRVSSLLSAGIPVAGSSDRPVVQGSPLLGIQAMVERRSAGGRVHGPDERVDAATALAAFTAGGARAANSEHLYGRIAPRLRADLVVLGDDPTAVDPASIGSIRVLATLVGGHAAHDPDGMLADALQQGSGARATMAGLRPRDSPGENVPGQASS